MDDRIKKYFVISLLSLFIIAFSLFHYIQPAFNQESTTSIFEFALIGDLPYDAEQEAKFPNLIAEINQSQLAFVVHDGDIKSGSTPCTDELFYQRKELFEKFDHPFILILGDNEWTDCHRPSAGGYIPTERLTKLRQIFFANNHSLGKQTLRFSQQSENPQYRQFKENIRWNYHNIMFVGLNVTGSNNNFGRTPEDDTEYRERNTANLAWIRESFALAKRNNSQGIMLIIQANPGFELEPTNNQRTGYNDFINALESETLNFDKQVVLVHGDSHYFRLDKPLLNSKNKRRIENFTRVETFGSPDVHWLRARVDPNDRNLFSFKQEIVELNKHKT